MHSTLTDTTSTTSRRWFTLAWSVPAALALLVAGARWLRGLPDVQAFVATYPGVSQLPAETPVGFPAWLGWQHFLTLLIVLLLIRSGWRVRTNLHPDTYWTRHNNGPIRTKNPPKKISLSQWFHLNLGVLLAVNGAVFYLLLAVTGQWKRVVPAGWDVFPHALSTLLQYASLDWPANNTWVEYNALQLLAYFVTVFVAAPLALATGARMSGAWPAGATRLNKAFPVEAARAVHFPVMLYFAGFIAVHVTMVLATGARRNLNHMYAMRDDTGWIGAVVFVLSIMVVAVAWVAAHPVLLRPVAGLTGRLSRR